MLTGTHSESASYEFTTLTCIPGIIHYNDTKIQLLDLPGIIEGASEGKGRGRQVKLKLLVSIIPVGFRVLPLHLKIDNQLANSAAVILPNTLNRGEVTIDLNVILSSFSDPPSPWGQKNIGKHGFWYY